MQQAFWRFLEAFFPAFRSRSSSKPDSSPSPEPPLITRIILLIVIILFVGQRLHISISLFFVLLFLALPFLTLLIFLFSPSCLVGEIHPMFQLWAALSLQNCRTWAHEHPAMAQHILGIPHVSCIPLMHLEGISSNPRNLKCLKRRPAEASRLRPAATSGPGS